MPKTFSAIHGSRSTGMRSIAFMKMIQMKTVIASGAMKLRSPCTIDLLCSSTISTIISTKAWKRPGTPGVAARAARCRRNSVSARQATEKMIVSRLMTEKSTMNFCLPVDRCVRWWTMYSVAVGAWLLAMVSFRCSAPDQGDQVAFQSHDDRSDHRQPNQITVRPDDQRQ